MKIISINLGVVGSTGKIMCGIQQISQKQGIEYYIAAPEQDIEQDKMEFFLPIGKKKFNRLNVYISILTGLEGCTALWETICFLKKIKSIDPDIIHLHNIHQSYINIPLLFNYLKKNKIKVVWTLHDCWSFTGHCPYFTYEKCDRWKTGCHHCPKYMEYPKSVFDNSRFMWKCKKKWFLGLENMILVTPSKWLAALVKESYLKDYPVKVVNNGIDLEIFKYIESDFRKKYNIHDKKIVLGVAFGWDKRKGLDVFVELSKRLPYNYQIVLVGTSSLIEEQLPENIICIHRTANQVELAKIYSAADIFVNPTRDENYPTVNMESIACGTPVLTFRTGGSPEILDETCGMIVKCDDIDSLEQGIYHICENNSLLTEKCLAKAKAFDMLDKFKEYMILYHELQK